jgi:uridine kinase
LLRRIERDTKERGRTMSSVIQQYHTTVKPMHDSHVEPSKKVADLIVHSNTSTTTTTNEPNGQNTTTSSSSTSMDLVVSILANHLRIVANI